MADFQPLRPQPTKSGHQPARTSKGPIQLVLSMKADLLDAILGGEIGMGNCYPGLP
jgi:hypothetical protein